MRVYDGGWLPSPRYSTAWYILITELAYFDLDSVACPSMDFAPASPGIVHYDYRYNSKQTYGSPQHYAGALTDGKRLREPLFHDSAGYRLKTVAPFTVYSESTTAHDQKRWAHGDGGDLIDASGSARWLPNSFHFTWAPRCWPSPYGPLRYQDTTLMDYLKE
jgi:hypothetical protein